MTDEQAEQVIIQALCREEAHLRQALAGDLKPGDFRHYSQALAQVRADIKRYQGAGQ